MLTDDVQRQLTHVLYGVALGRYGQRVAGQAGVECGVERGLQKELGVAVVGMAEAVAQHIAQQVKVAAHIRIRRIVQPLQQRSGEGTELGR